MPSAAYRPETDSFAFTNSWSFDATETATLRTIVTNTVGGLAAFLSPFIWSIEGPELTVLLHVPFIGPWLVYKVIEEQTNAVVNPIIAAVTANAYGLCGGMTFASLDYWLNSWVVPRGLHNNDQPDRTSPQGTELRDYLWNRLLQSVQDNITTFLQWMAVLHFPVGPQASWLRDQTIGELIKLKARIDTGIPVPVGLIGTTWNPLENHQVLVYAYDDNLDGTTTLTLYDNNEPSVPSTINLDLSGPALIAIESAAPGARGPLQGFFCTIYNPSTPPVAVVLRAGLTVSPAKAAVGSPVDVQMEVANIGFHSSPPLALVAAGDNGTAVMEKSFTSIPQGGARVLGGQLTFSTPGDHQIAALVSIGNASAAIIRFLPPEGPGPKPGGDVEIVGQ